MRHMLKKLVIFSVVVIGLSQLTIAAENETVDSIVRIINQAPYVVNITLDDNDIMFDNEIDLSPNATEAVSCYGYVNDTNGYDDLLSVSANIYAASSQAYNVGDAYIDHYSNSSCFMNGLDGYFNCSFNVMFYAENSTWTCAVNVTDTQLGSNTTSLNDTADVLDLVAIDILNSTLDFGTRALGTTTPTELNVSIMNEGNIEIDLQLDAYEQNYTGNQYDNAYAFNCTLGELPVDYLRFNATANGLYAGSTSMTQAGLTDISNFDMPHQTTGTIPYEQGSYWAVGLPSSGLSGTCTGRVIYVALASGG